MKPETGNLTAEGRGRRAATATNEVRGKLETCGIQMVDVQRLYFRESPLPTVRESCIPDIAKTVGRLSSVRSCRKGLKSPARRSVAKAHLFWKGRKGQNGHKGLKLFWALMEKGCPRLWDWVGLAVLAVVWGLLLGGQA